MITLAMLETNLETTRKSYRSPSKSQKYLNNFSLYQSLLEFQNAKIKYNENREYYTL